MFYAKLSQQKRLEPTGTSSRFAVNSYKSVSFYYYPNRVPQLPQKTFLVPTLCHRKGRSGRRLKTGQADRKGRLPVVFLLEIVVHHSRTLVPHKPVAVRLCLC